MNFLTKNFYSVCVIVLLIASNVGASLGPPKRISAQDRNLNLEIGTGERYIDFDGTVGSSTIFPSKLKASTTNFAGRLCYGLADRLSVYALLGASRMNIGNLELQAQGISQGILGLKGEYGFLWGIGGEYVLNPSSNWSDLMVGFSAEYRNFYSSINGGKIDIDDFRFAIKGAMDMDKLIPYAGVVYAPMRGKYNGTTTSGIGASGSIESRDDFGVIAGAEYAFTEKISGRLEAELISQSSISLGLVYNWGGPWMRRQSAPKPPAPEYAAPENQLEISSRENLSAPRVSEIDIAETDNESIPKPEAAEENMRFGNELVALGKYDEAIIFYKRAYAMDSKNFRVVYNLATAQYLNRDYLSARNSYEIAVKLEPRDVETHLFLGFANYRLGNVTDAARAWKRVLELDPNNAVALNNLQALNQ
ncbi:MAG: hypothetical protein AUJ18_09975 [Candidatus Hydrogenedentes bacterium CG1_02_42_14]|nr:MAG: hypothetical protein AUJ18_09975 [Candidatus Hydrogenedentes bacterium CG1_02_42_14]